MDVVDAFVKFYDGFVQEGVSKDGMPIYKSTPMIVMSKPPYMQTEPTPATAADFENFPDPYKLYTNTAKVKKTATGYPLAMWMGIDAAEFEMCAARGITTVEQLAAIGKKADQPPQIVELVGRAKRLVELQKNVGQFEAMIRDLEGRVETLTAELNEARAVNAANMTLIDQLKMRVA
jgi:hypothetical protein